MKILIDISDIQFGYSGIVHDLVSNIKILQNSYDIDYLYIQYYKFNYKSEFEINQQVIAFLKKEGLTISAILIHSRFNYFDKLLKLFKLQPLKLNTVNYKYLISTPSFLYKVSSNTKLIIKIFDLIYITHPNLIKHSFLNKKYLTNTIEFLKNNNAEFVCISRNTQENLESIIGTCNTKILNCPINHNIIDSNMERLITAKYILFCATIEPKKNIIKLCEAFEILQKNKTYLDTKLVIVGKKGWLADDIIKKIENTKNVIWAKDANDEKRNNYYKFASCFVFPSIVEGFGMPPLEAMSFGIPTISSDIPVHREIQGDAAFFCDPNNAYDIAEKIQYVLDPINADEVRKYIKKGFEQVKKYDTESITKQWKEALNL